MSEIRFRIGDKIIFYDSDKVKLISGKVNSITANYRKSTNEEYYTDINYSVWTEQILYTNIKQNLIFNNKKEFYDTID